MVFTESLFRVVKQADMYIIPLWCHSLIYYKYHWRGMNEWIACQPDENPAASCNTCPGSGRPPSGQPEAQRRERRPHPSHQQAVEMKRQWITRTKSSSEYSVPLKPRSERVSGDAAAPRTEHSTVAVLPFHVAFWHTYCERGQAAPPVDWWNDPGYHLLLYSLTSYCTFKLTVL